MLFDWTGSLSSENCMYRGLMHPFLPHMASWPRGRKMTGFSGFCPEHNTVLTVHTSCRVHNLHIHPPTFSRRGAGSYPSMCEGGGGVTPWTSCRLTSCTRRTCKCPPLLFHWERIEPGRCYGGSLCPLFFTLCDRTPRRLQPCTYALARKETTHSGHLHPQSCGRIGKRWGTLG